MTEPRRSMIDRGVWEAIAYREENLKLNTHTIFKISGEHYIKRGWYYIIQPMYLYDNVIFGICQNDLIILIGDKETYSYTNDMKKNLLSGREEVVVEQIKRIIADILSIKSRQMCSYGGVGRGVINKLMADTNVYELDSEISEWVCSNIDDYAKFRDAPTKLQTSRIGDWRKIYAYKEYEYSRNNMFVYSVGCVLEALLGIDKIKVSNNQGIEYSNKKEDKLLQKTVLAVTMEWIIHYTDGDTWVQDNTYQFDADILNHKREKIIKECVELYGDNIDYIEFKVKDETHVIIELKPYRHKKDISRKNEINSSDNKNYSKKDERIEGEVKIQRKDNTSAEKCIKSENKTNVESDSSNSDADIYLMNVDKAVEQKKYDDAVKYLKLAWELNAGGEVEDKCVKKLKVLKHLGYAKDIHWDIKILLERMFIASSSIVLVFLICLFIWNLKVASIAGAFMGGCVIYSLIITSSKGIVKKILEIIGILLAYAGGCIFWIVVADYVCSKIWGINVAETVVKVLKFLFILETPFVFYVMKRAKNKSE